MGKKDKRIKELEILIKKPDLWKDQKQATKISEELKESRDEVRLWQEMEKEVSELLEMLELAEKDEKLVAEIEDRYKDIEKKFKKEEIGIFLSGRYDRKNAILSIYSGAGGVDAQDWASMLLRMYQRYSEKGGYKSTILHHSFGEEGGTKSVTLEIKGKYVYGYLREEAGVHRLVRISPFSPQHLRHTSFALIDILPDIGKDVEKEIKIKPEDLRIDTYRASGPGGQYVNRRETAVRITHIPTGLVAACQNERSQAQNKERAMKLLYTKLYQQELKRKESERKELRGEIPSAEWGNQIRSYVLHPYKMVKDHRTGAETSDILSVLDGELDQFIESELRRGITRKTARNSAEVSA